jgi:hypothetical protein
MGMFAAVAGLLAQIDEPEKLEALRRGFHQETSQTHFLGVFVAIAVLCGVYLVVRICRRRPGRDDQLIRIGHLAESAHVLGLVQEELDDLRTVAGKASLSHPAAMLLSPANLAHAARAAQDGKMDPALQERMDRLATKLFGKRLAECEPPPPESVS